MRKHDASRMGGIRGDYSLPRTPLGWIDETQSPIKSRNPLVNARLRKNVPFGSIDITSCGAGLDVMGSSAREGGP